ncbi:cutinase family protein [Gordonia sp. ABSL11-1]|uniref:cutinase family protein n=1 Tax=Gordonia sp. ABSL11-1 TaxID=3053924 RepID=UPI002574204F|nr:cutinase family protein [Gordonia sp. ABSL11-1]MDL9945903.1 cutinase family protein [Gordonia sp. ABSL11-1]
MATAFCLPGVGGVARADDCGAGAVVIVGGTWDHEGAVMVGVKQRYTGLGPDDKANPASDYAGEKAYKIIYADYPAAVWPAGATGYDESTRQGIASTKSAIAGYQQSCGDMPVVVAGYSQGARIAGDVLSDIGNGRGLTGTSADGAGYTINPETISGELYADPRQDGDKTGKGIELSLIGVIPGMTMSGARDGGFGSLADNVVSVCIDGDPICDLPDPMYDPIGAIDGLAGYWVKHGRYPYYMFQNPRADWWSGRNVDCTGTNDTTCVVEFDSSIVEYLREQAANLGYTGEIGDFLANRPKIGLPLGITLANLQPAIRVVQDLLPPLPQLGYGAYLADIYVFEDILQGIVNRAPEQFTAGAAALAASVRSIIRWPVSFTRYWADQLVTVVGAQTAVQTSTTARAAVEQHAETLQTLAAVEHPGATVVETSTPDVRAPGQTHDDLSVSATSPAVEPVAPSRSGPEPRPEPETVVEAPPVVAADPEPEAPPADTGSTSGGAEPGDSSDRSTEAETSTTGGEETGGAEVGDAADSTSGSSKKSSESSSKGGGHDGE